MRDELSLAWIDAFISIFVDDWGCRLDHEDGSTAPFSAIAALEADALEAELDACLKVLTE